MKKLFKIATLIVILGLCITLMTACTKTKYTINFVTNGGSNVEAIVLAEGSKLAKPEDPTKEDSKFVGWFEDVLLTTKYIFPQTMPAKSFNLYAKWEKGDRKITFNSNGGSHVEAISAPALTKLDMPDDPVKENRVFAGWFVDEEFEIPFDNVMPINHTTVYAKWVNVEETTKLTLDKNWSSADSDAYNIITVDDITNIAVLEGKATYSYFGIRISRNVKAYSTFVMDVSGTKGEEVLLKCQNGGVVVTEKKFILNGNENQKLVWTVSADNLTDGQAAMNFYVFVRPGQTGGAGTILTIKNFELFRVVEEGNDYQSVIHFDSLGGSGINSIFADTNATISEPTQKPVLPGYTFKGWYTTDDLEVPFVFDKMPEGQTTVYAKWQSNENVTLRFDSLGGTSVESLILPTGTTLSDKIPEDPTKGELLFGGWYKDTKFEEAFEWSTMPDEDFTLYARWVVLEENTAIILSNKVTTTQKYIIQENDNGSVSVSIDAGKTTYSMFGTKLALNAKNYSYFKITFRGTEGINILFKCQNGGVTATETKVLMTGEEQTIYWKVSAKNLTNGQSPMDLYMCIDPGVAHATKPENDIYITLNEIKVLRTVDVSAPVQNVIHFATDGGSVVDPIFAEKNETIVLPSATKRGYELVGWFTDLELTQEFTDNKMLEQNTILYAKWQEVTGINSYLFTNSSWQTQQAYSNYATNIADNKLEINYDHASNNWTANAGATYQFRGLNEDKIHYTKLKINIKLTETTKAEDINLRFRFFGIDENYTYNGSKTPTLQCLVKNADLGRDIEIILDFSKITNATQFAHLDSLIMSEQFNMLLNIYTSSASPSYGVGKLIVNSMELC